MRAWRRQAKRLHRKARRQLRHPSGEQWVPYRLDELPTGGKMELWAQAPDGMRRVVVLKQLPYPVDGHGVWEAVLDNGRHRVLSGRAFLYRKVVGT